MYTMVYDQPLFHPGMLRDINYAKYFERIKLDNFRPARRIFVRRGKIIYTLLLTNELKWGYLCFLYTKYN